MKPKICYCSEGCYETHEVNVSAAYTGCYDTSDVAMYATIYRLL